MPYKEVTYEEFQKDYEYYKKHYILIKAYDKSSIMTLSGKKLWVLLKERRR